MQYPLAPPPIKNIPKQLNEQNSQQTQDDLKSFSVSQLIDKQINIQKMDTQQLVNYCHSEWKEWIKCMIQFQQCIRQEEEIANKGIGETRINVAQSCKTEDLTNEHSRRGQILPNDDSHQIRRQIPMYPGTFLGKDFEHMLRSQNSFPMAQTSFMGGPLNPVGIPMKPSDHQFIHNSSMNQNRSPFPFPFPQGKPVVEGIPGVRYEHSNFNQSLKIPFPNQDQSKHDERQNQPKQ